MRIGRTSIGIMICACSLFALGLTACGGDKDSSNGCCPLKTEVEPLPEEGPGTHSYRITNPNMGQPGCIPLNLLLECNTPANCMDKIGLSSAGYMDVAYTETDVLIEIMNPLNDSITVPLFFEGTRTETTFSAAFNTSLSALNCNASVEVTVSGGDISAESFSGTISAGVVVTNCGIFNSDCQISSNYEAQRHTTAADGFGIQQRLSSPVEFQAASPEEAQDQLGLILRSLFLME